MAIEPISGFYVHDELTSTDGIAKYDFFGLANAPDDFEPVYTYEVDRTASGAQRDYFGFNFTMGEQYLVEVDLEDYTPRESGSGLIVQTYTSYSSADPTANIADAISGSIPASQVAEQKYRWSYVPSTTGVTFLYIFTGIAENSHLQYTARVYRLKGNLSAVQSTLNKQNADATLSIALGNGRKILSAEYDETPSAQESRLFLPYKFRSGAKYLVVLSVDTLYSRNGINVRTSTGQPSTIRDTAISYTKESGTYYATFTATADANYLYVYTSHIWGTRVAYSIDAYEIEGAYSYEGERVDMNEYTYNLGTLLQTTKPSGYGTYQGIAIYGDKLYRLFVGGYCAVYDLSVADGSSQEALGSFALGSVASSNHAGVGNFSDTVLSGYDVPPLYVSAGDANSPSTCFVEQISESNGAYSSTLLQTITLDQSGFGEAGLQTFFPWGKWCPYGDFLYLVSSLTRANGSTDRRTNKYIVTKFALPSTSADKTLTASDVLEQFTLPFVDEFAQGMTIKNGKMFQVFGYPEGGFPARVSVISLPSHAPIATLDISKTAASSYELEDCAVYDGKLVVGSTSNDVVQITFC